MLYMNSIPDLKITKIEHALQYDGDFVFLSSLCKELEERGIRKEIHQRINTPGNGLIPVFVDEEYKKRENAGITGNDLLLEIADDLAKIISKSKFVIIL